MQPVVTVETMRQSDAWTIAHETPGRTLMARAAQGIFQAVPWADAGPAGILIGSGNNGGDGAALACILARHRLPCTLFQLSEKASPDNAYYLAQARALGVPILPFAAAETGGADCPVLVDCILGTGFTGTVRGVPRQAIAWLNRRREQGAFVVSADINSGLDGDTGLAELAVVSDLTVSIGFFKLGMFRGDAARYIRRLVNADIGIRLQKQEYWLVPPDQADPADPRQIPCPPYCAG